MAPTGAACCMRCPAAAPACGAPATRTLLMLALLPALLLMPAPARGGPHIRAMHGSDDGGGGGGAASEGPLPPTLMSSKTVFLPPPAPLFDQQGQQGDSHAIAASSRARPPHPPHRLSSKHTYLPPPVFQEQQQQQQQGQQQEGQSGGETGSTSAGVGRDSGGTSSSTVATAPLPPHMLSSKRQFLPPPPLPSSSSSSSSPSSDFQLPPPHKLSSKQQRVAWPPPGATTTPAPAALQHHLGARHVPYPPHRLSSKHQHFSPPPLPSSADTNAASMFANADVTVPPPHRLSSKHRFLPPPSAAATAPGGLAASGKLLSALQLTTQLQSAGGAPTSDLAALLFEVQEEPSASTPSTSTISTTSTAAGQQRYYYVTPTTLGIVLQAPGSTAGMGGATAGGGSSNNSSVSGVFLPRDGYWNSNPYSEQVRACLPGRYTYRSTGGGTGGTTGSTTGAPCAYAGRLHRLYGFQAALEGGGGTGRRYNAARYADLLCGTTTTVAVDVGGTGGTAAGGTGSTGPLCGACAAGWAPAAGAPGDAAPGRGCGLCPSSSSPSPSAASAWWGTVASLALWACLRLLPPLAAAALLAHLARRAGPVPPAASPASPHGPSSGAPPPSGTLSASASMRRTSTSGFARQSVDIGPATITMEAAHLGVTGGGGGPGSDFRQAEESDPPPTLGISTAFGSSTSLYPLPVFPTTPPDRPQARLSQELLDSASSVQRHAGAIQQPPRQHPRQYDRPAGSTSSSTSTAVHYSGSRHYGGASSPLRHRGSVDRPDGIAIGGTGGTGGKGVSVRMTRASVNVASWQRDGGGTGGTGWGQFGTSPSTEDEDEGFGYRTAPAASSGAGFASHLREIRQAREGFMTEIREHGNAAEGDQAVATTSDNEDSPQKAKGSSLGFWGRLAAAAAGAAGQRTAGGTAGQAGAWGGGGEKKGAGGSATSWEVEFASAAGTSKRTRRLSHTDVKPRRSAGGTSLFPTPSSATAAGTADASAGSFGTLAGVPFDFGDRPLNTRPRGGADKDKDRDVRERSFTFDLGRKSPTVSKTSASARSRLLASSPAVQEPSARSSFFSWGVPSKDASVKPLLLSRASSMHREPAAVPQSKASMASCCKLVAILKILVNYVQMLLAFRLLLVAPWDVLSAAWWPSPASSPAAPLWAPAASLQCQLPVSSALPRGLAEVLVDAMVPLLLFLAVATLLTASAAFRECTHAHAAAAAAAPPSPISPKPPLPPMSSYPAILPASRQPSMDIRLGGVPLATSAASLDRSRTASLVLPTLGGSTGTSSLQAVQQQDSSPGSVGGDTECSTECVVVPAALLAVCAPRGTDATTLARTLVLWAVAITFCFYQPRLQSLLSLFACTDVDAPSAAWNPAAAEAGLVTDARWTYDTTVACYEGAHARMAYALGIPLLALMVLVLPVLLAGYLWYNRQLLWRYNRPIAAGGGGTAGTAVWRLGGALLYSEYADGAYCWEAVVLLRKAAVTALLVLPGALGGAAGGTAAVGGATLQLLACQLAVAVAIAAHWAWQPFRDRSLYRLELASLCALFSTLSCTAVVLLLDGSGPSHPPSLVALATLLCMVAANVATVFAFAWSIACELHTLFVEHLLAAEYIKDRLKVQNADLRRFLRAQLPGALSLLAPVLAPLLWGLCQLGAAARRTAAPGGSATPSAAAGSLGGGGGQAADHAHNA